MSKLVIGRKISLRLQNLVPLDGPLPECPLCHGSLMVTGNQGSPWVVCFCGVRIPVEPATIKRGAPEELVTSSLEEAP